MIVDHRTYSLHPGRLPDYLALYEREGLPVQSRHLGAPLGWYVTEVGDVNGIVHLWGYADMEDRARRRAAMQADPDWQAFLRVASPHLASMSNRILRPAPFFRPPSPA